MLVVTQLREDQVAAVDDRLPLHRLDQWRAEGSTYLIAWEDDSAVGHAHIAWSDTHLGLPEIQDVFVPPELRRRGIASRLTAEAESEVARRGFDTVSLSVSATANEPARALYDLLGYGDSGVEPVRVTGEIVLRGRPLAVDDTLVYLVKRLAPAG